MPDSWPFRTACHRVDIADPVCNAVISNAVIRLTGSRTSVVLAKLICSGLLLLSAGGCDRTSGHSPAADISLAAANSPRPAAGSSPERESHQPSSPRLSTATELPPSWMIPYHEALSGERDAVHGKTIFARACRNCHRLEGDGYQVGANLNLIDQKSDVQIMLDILDPSREIKPEFRTWTVVTKDGFVSNGLMFSESEDSLTLRKENGMVQLIFRHDIELATISDVSLMPGNLREQLKPAELADLMTYLRQASASSR